jgi:hypothetical protein
MTQEFQRGDIVIHTDGTLRKVIGYSVTGNVVTIGANDGRRPEVRVCEEGELVKVDVEVTA